MSWGGELSSAQLKWGENFPVKNTHHLDTWDSESRGKEGNYAVKGGDVLAWTVGWSGLDYILLICLYLVLTNDTSLHETGGEAASVRLGPGSLLVYPLVTGQSFLKQLLLFLPRLPLFSPGDRILSNINRRVFNWELLSSVHCPLFSWMPVIPTPSHFTLSVTFNKGQTEGQTD